jgi:high-affinity Fe2+/Pb2+ permease
MKPPLWIRLPSYFFIYLAVVTLALWSLAAFAPIHVHQKLTIGFFTSSFAYEDHPELFVVASLLIILAGATGLMIVTRKRFAYDFGIFFPFALLLFSRLPIAPGLSLVL